MASRKAAGALFRLDTATRKDAPAGWVETTRRHLLSSSSSPAVRTSNTSGAYQNLANTAFSQNAGAMGMLQGAIRHLPGK
jgi:hypothetical protein